MPAPSFAFSPAGIELAAAGDSGAQLWAIAPVTPASAVRALCAEAGATWSATQWQQYAPGVPYQDVCPGNPAAA